MYLCHQTASFDNRQRTAKQCGWVCNGGPDSLTNSNGSLAHISALTDQVTCVLTVDNIYEICSSPAVWTKWPLQYVTCLNASNTEVGELGNAMRQTDSDVAMKRNNCHGPDSRHVAYRRHRKRHDVHVRMHFLHNMKYSLNFRKLVHKNAPVYILRYSDQS